MTDELKLVVLEPGQGRERMWALDRLVSVSGAEEKSGDRLPLDTEDMEAWGTQAPSSTPLGPSCRL